MNQQQPGLVILVVVAAVIGGGWLFLQIVGGCIALLGAGLGADPTFAVVAGFFIAIGLTVHALTRSNK
jgi:hypothetical protein